MCRAVKHIVLDAVRVVHVRPTCRVSSESLVNNGGTRSRATMRAVSMADDHTLEVCETCAMKLHERGDAASFELSDYELFTRTSHTPAELEELTRLAAVR